MPGDREEFSDVLINGVIPATYNSGDCSVQCRSEHSFMSMPQIYCVGQGTWDRHQHQARLTLNQPQTC